MALSPRRFPVSGIVESVSEREGGDPPYGLPLSESELAILIAAVKRIVPPSDTETRLLEKLNGFADYIKAKRLVERFESALTDARPIVIRLAAARDREP